jgi:protein O-mannosyl-transferase
MKDSPTASLSRPDCRLTLVICLFLFFSTFALFSPAIGHGFVDYDDPIYVTQNPHVQHGITSESLYWAFTTGHAANWHPLTWLSHMLDWKLYGDDARGHHVTSIFWHSLSAAMAFLMLRKLTGALWPSALAAAIFAWHPLRVESVAWIAERKDVLSVFFGLLTIWAYAGYAHRLRDRRNSIVFYIFTLLSLAVGLLCKPTLVTLPCLLLLLDFWPLGRFPGHGENASPLWRLLLEKIPFFAMAAASSIITYRVQKAGGAMVEKIPLTGRLANAAVAAVRYLHKFAWPFNLAVCYPYPTHWPAPLVGGCILFILLVTAIALRQWRRRPWILTGWLWYLGTLVPVVGIVQVGMQSLADRYTYLPLIGIEIAILWTLRERKCPANAHWLKPVVASLVLIALAARTLNQLSDWQTPEILYTHARDVTNDNYMAWCFLGSEEFRQNHLDEARADFEKSLEFKPDYSVARYRLGLVLDKLGYPDQALAEYREVLQSHPDDAKAHYSLGVNLLEQKQPAAAIPYFQFALQGRDDYDDSQTCLAMGMAYVRMNEPQPAMDSFQHAIDLYPNNPEANFDYANLLDSLDRNEQALAEYEKAIQLNPAFAAALCNEGNLLRKMGRPTDAADRYHRAIEIDPQNAQAYFGLAAAQEDMNQPDQAMANYLQAVKIRPAYPDAQYNLGVMYLNAGRADAALPHFQEAVQAAPDYDAALVGLGICQNQTGDLAAAAESLQRSISLNPGNADAHYFLGLTYQSMGHNDQAIAEWQQTLRLNPDYAGVADLIAKTRAATTHPASTSP